MLAQVILINTDDEEDLDPGAGPVSTGSAPEGAIVPSLPKGATLLLKEAQSKGGGKKKKRARDNSKPLEVKDLEDTNITTMKSSKNQLLQQALQTADARKRLKKKRKTAKKDPARKLTEALTAVLKKSSSSRTASTRHGRKRSNRRME